MISGFLGFVIPKSLVGLGISPFAGVFVNFLDPFFIGIYLSLFFALIGTKLHQAGTEEMEYHEKLMILPDKEKAASEYKRDRRYGYILIIAGVITTLVLLFGWALPYNGMI